MQRHLSHKRQNLMNAIDCYCQTSQNPEVATCKVYQRQKWNKSSMRWNSHLSKFIRDWMTGLSKGWSKNRIENLWRWIQVIQKFLTQRVQNKFMLPLQCFYTDRWRKWSQRSEMRGIKQNMRVTELNAESYDTRQLINMAQSMSSTEEFLNTHWWYH